MISVVEGLEKKKSKERCTRHEAKNGQGHHFNMSVAGLLDSVCAGEVCWHRFTVRHAKVRSTNIIDSSHSLIDRNVSCLTQEREEGTSKKKTIEIDRPVWIGSSCHEALGKSTRPGYPK